MSLSKTGTQKIIFMAAIFTDQLVKFFRFLNQLKNHIYRRLRDFWVPKKQFSVLHFVEEWKDNGTVRRYC